MAGYRGYARLREDMTLAGWCFKSRSNETNQCSREAIKGITLPQAVRSFQNPSSIKLGIVAGGLWKTFCEMLNPADAIKYITRLGSGWRNQGAEWQFECLTFARNVVYITGQSLFLDKSYVLALDMTQHPNMTLGEFGLNMDNANFTSLPHLIHCFTAVTPDNRTVLATFGDPKHDAQIYIFLMRDHDHPRYFKTTDLEFFPKLPYNAIVTVPGLNVRSTPGGERISVGLDDAGQLKYLVLPEGSPVTIKAYRPRGSAVWGLIDTTYGPGWIAIEHPDIYGWFSTTWRMQTLPPPVR